MFWRKKQKAVSGKTDFPTGVVVDTENGMFFVKNGTLLRVSTTVKMSWDFPLVVNAEWSSIKHMPIAGRLGFRDGTVIKAFGSRKIYLISGQKTRHITDPATVETLGITLDNVIMVSDDDVRLNTEGEQLGSI